MRPLKLVWSGLRTPITRYSQLRLKKSILTTVASLVTRRYGAVIINSCRCWRNATKRRRTIQMILPSWCCIRKKRFRIRFPPIIYLDENSYTGDKPYLAIAIKVLGYIPFCKLKIVLLRSIDLWGVVADEKTWRTIEGPICQPITFVVGYIWSQTRFVSTQHYVLHLTWGIPFI